MGAMIRVWSPLIVMATLLAVNVVCLVTDSKDLADDDSHADDSFASVTEYIDKHGCDVITHNRTSVVHDCIRRTLHFFRKYLTRLDKGKSFDVCRRFHDISGCVEPILHSCPMFREQYSHILGPINEYFKCACSEEAACMENMHCFEVEYRGILSQRCDAYYKFNLQQKTHKACYFLQENIDCKVSLVSTACDRRTGEFAFNIYKFLAMHETKTARCVTSFTPVESYEGFYYDDNCPTYFLQDLATCSSNHLWNQMLHFDKENDLVARGTKELVRETCSSYKSYRKCIRHPRKACKSGTKEIFNYGTNLRKYALKMDYICKASIKQEYTQSLSCYQNVIVNESLKQCDYIYKDLKPWLYSVTAYQFYCRQNSEDVINMNSQLHRLRSCYQEIFELRCGDKAGNVIGGLIELAFQDPAYLRYSYKPDCKLHRKSTRLKVDEDGMQSDGTRKDERDVDSISSATSLRFALPLVLVLVHLTWNAIRISL